MRFMTTALHMALSRIRLLPFKEEFSIQDNERREKLVSVSIVENMDTVYELILSDCRIALKCIT